MDLHKQLAAGTCVNLLHCRGDLMPSLNDVRFDEQIVRRFCQNGYIHSVDAIGSHNPRCSRYISPELFNIFSIGIVH